MAEALTIRDVQFVKGAAQPAQFPDWPRPEIAFGGRSNVGKSSLLRSLLGRRRMVRVSRTPGRTREVNFFRLELAGIACAFVDLPGYGYARVPGKLKTLWGRTVEQYVVARVQLAGLVLLLDARRLPGSDEQGLLDFLTKRGRICLPVYTKIDKLPKPRRQAALWRNQEHLGLETRPVGFSALTGEGRDEVLTRVQRLVADAAPGPNASKESNQ